MINERETLSGCQAEDDGRDAIEGNPCDAGTGNKIEIETDYASDTLTFTRYYNSNGQYLPNAGFGTNWTHNYAMKIRFSAETGGYPTARIREDGQAEILHLISGKYISERSGAFLIANGSDWDLHLANGSKHRYNSTGALQWIENALGQRTTLTYGAYGVTKITGPFGHAITLEYEEDEDYIVSMTDPAGETYSYEGSDVNVYRVTYPDLTQRFYHYADGLRLTGITDENVERYSTYAYDASGRVISTEHAGGYEKFTLQYNANATTTVTDALSNQTTYEFASMALHGKAGRRRPTTFTRNGQTFSRTYTSAGAYVPHKPAVVTDENGVITTFTYNTSAYQRTKKIEADGTADERETNYTYLSTSNHRLTEVETESVYASGDRTVSISYDASQRPESITTSGYTPSGTAISRTIELEYNSYDLVAEIDGPRTDVSDVTTLTYYECTTGAECGQLESVTNALGHVTTYDSYDDNGRLLEMTDPNNVVTTYTYDLRGRTTSITETPPSGPARVTTYDYDDAGQLEVVNAPNGTTLTHEYDAAHNLLSVTDNLGNKIEYGYDLNGNLTDEDYLDPSEVLTKTLEYTYDARNRIDTINSAGSITDLLFDAVGNLTDETDPNSNDTEHTLDPLDRLSTTLDALSGTTSYDYDVNDFLVSVEAPNGATTTYTYDDLGNLLSMSSPDTGTTSYTYDAAGNRLTQTDANSVTTTYTYDALNRLLTVSYPNSGLDVTLTYDENTNQKGFLTTMVDGSGTTSLSYDVFGNLLEEEKTIDSDVHVTAYTYDEADLVESITYPSGRTVDYTRNVLGQITQVDTTYDTTSQTVASSIAYLPFGPVSGLTHGNSLALARDYDQQYRLTDITTGSIQDLDFTHDAASNIDAIADGVVSGLSQGFTQDELHRIDWESGEYGTKAYTYDEVGNRLTRVHTDGGVTTQTLTYTSDSNRLATHDGNTVTLDAAGNTTVDITENVSFVYDDHNRMVEAYVGAVLQAAYVYNGQGQRAKKIEATGSQRTFVFHYGLDGELIGETVSNSSGGKIEERDYVWLDALPLAQSERTFSGSTITSDLFVHIHADQLNTPRLATDGSGTVVWRWDSDGFGVGDADDDPDLDMNLVNIRLRFPGQYLDDETGLHYNYFRDYDPVTGRYVESDPIGLEGGIATYAYALGNPALYSDPSGEFVPAVVGCLFNPICRTAVARIGAAVFGLWNGYDVARDTKAAYETEDDPCTVVDERLIAAGVLAMGILDPTPGNLGRKGLLTPSRYFRERSTQQIRDALRRKYGPPRSVRAGAETYYNPRSRRSYNVHADPRHGEPHVDVRRRGSYADRRYPTGGGQ